MNHSEWPGLSEETRLKLFQLKEIAPPAGMAREIIRVAGDEQVELDDVVATIERSPEIAARILHCANSAYYGQRSRIHSVRDAVIRVLGLSVTKSLMLAMALSGCFQLRPCPGFSRERHWFVAVATAGLARDLAADLLTPQRPAPATAYMAGLLHNLGLLALVHAFPTELARVFAEADPVRGEDLLRQLVGIDAPTAGSWLAARWGLPEEMAQVMGHHLDPGFRGTNWPLVRLVGLAAQLAGSLFDRKEPGEVALGAEGLLPTSRVSEATGQLAGQRDALLELAELLAGSGS